MPNGSAGLLLLSCMSPSLLIRWLEDAAEDFRVGKKALNNIKFSVFGCGNRQYGENFNVVGMAVDATLKKMGASRIVEMHVGDEDRGNTEKQFSRWTHKAIKKKPTQFTLHVRFSVQILNSLTETRQPFAVELEEEDKHQDAEVHKCSNGDSLIWID